MFIISFCFYLCSKQISVLSITLIHSLLLIVSLLLPTCSKLPKTLSSDFKLLLQKLLISFWNSNSIQCTSALIFLSSFIKKRKKNSSFYPQILFFPHPLSWITVMPAPSHPHLQGALIPLCIPSVRHTYFTFWKPLKHVISLDLYYMDLISVPDNQTLEQLRWSHPCPTLSLPTTKDMFPTIYFWLLLIIFLHSPLFPG